jgi:hypothetical protein
MVPAARDLAQRNRHNCRRIALGKKGCKRGRLFFSLTGADGPSAFWNERFECDSPTHLNGELPLDTELKSEYKRFTESQSAALFSTGKGGNP